MADRVERLTNLLALLLESTRSMTLVEIADKLDGQYPQADRARRAAFERDKAALRDLGVPIDTEVLAGTETAGATAYAIDRSKYELDDLRLDGDEMRALQVAVAAVRTNSSAGRDALWKLGGEVDVGGVPVSAVVPDRPELPIIRQAVAARSSMTFSYRGDQRQIDPWGLLLRGGFWYVVGHDHLRNAQRTFRIDRFDGGVDGIAIGPPDGFERPVDFDPRSAFPADPKQIGHAASDGVEAIVEVDSVRAAAIEREVGADRVVDRSTDGSIRVRVPASNLAAFRSWLLGLLDHAVVIEPADIRAEVVGWLESLVDG